jgi:anaerobic magnesium-protoporphyrin IX monomethyl ester cyclase
MRILLVNVPHPAIGSRIPDDHLPPLGLLAIGGPLIDDGHEVQLLDAEFGPMSTAGIVAQTVRFRPDAVLFGHSGSTSGHPVIAEVSHAIAHALPDAHIIYGGVFPTYHWREILSEEPHVIAIVRGEGEETIRQLIGALETQSPLDQVRGIAYRDNGRPTATAPAVVIRDLDAYRIGWELIDHRRYTYWGGPARRRRAVLTRLPASLQLLRTTRLLDALASS